MRSFSVFKRIVYAILLTLLLLIVGWMGYVSRLTHQNDRACDSNYDQARGDSLLQNVMSQYSEKRNVGLQATIILPDGAQWNGSSGFANRKKKCPVSMRHHFGIGSVTKLYTATMIMRQVETGTISLDDSVSKWLNLPYAKQLTVRMLLNQTSGIPDYTSDPMVLLRYIGLPEKSWRPYELADVFSNRPLIFDPGLRHEYSNSNYLLLGIILEEASGKSYTTLLQEMMHQLGLYDTFYLYYSDDILIANAYDEDLLHLGTQNLTGLRLSLHSGAHSAGGIISTSIDVALFTRALFTGEVISAESLAQMVTFVDVTDKDAPERRGYGFGVRQLVINDEVFVGHTGAIPGYSGVAVYSANNGISIAILGNLSVIEQERLLAGILEALSP